MSHSSMPRTERESRSSAVAVARDYYNSHDADAFYSSVWGGEDIHIGIYRDDDEPIADASRRTAERMAALSRRLDDRARVLDIGAGYGGTARYLACSYGCHVTCLNLSEVENARNRAISAERGLDAKIEVIDGNFERLPFDDQAFDLVWSQDAILHSERREAVLAEAWRVLRPGGELIFTDPMQADDCPGGDVLAPILERIHLQSLGSPRFYQDAARRIGFEIVTVRDETPNLARHYRRVLQETERREAELSERISPAYIERMKKGLGHWIDGGERGHLAWALFCFRRPTTEGA